MKKILLFLTLCGALCGCRKLIELDTPQNQLVPAAVFKDSASVNALIGNTYALFNTQLDANFTLPLGLYSDELNYTATNAGVLEYLGSRVSATNTNYNLWKNQYQVIYQCNDVIIGLATYTEIPISTRLRFTAEAKFLRAYAYFNLVNVYGSVPLLLTTDVSQNAVASRIDSASVYAQILRDLQDARSGLSATYSGAGKVRANSYAATAMLARVYLYLHQYSEAEEAATAVIASGLYSPLPPLTINFQAGSKESILQIYNQNGFTAEGALFVPASGKPTYPITDALAGAFEVGDLRKTAWLNKVSVTAAGVTTIYNYPYKYHNRTTGGASTEYLSLLRLGEQYLIRAEARFYQKKLSAVDDINVLRSRAGLPSLTSLTDISTILQERRVEMFLEWGQRFLDLRRTGRLAPYLALYKNSTWQSRGTLLPIPQSELNYDPFLTQNNGY